MKSVQVKDVEGIEKTRTPLTIVLFMFINKLDNHVLEAVYLSGTLSANSAFIWRDAGEIEELAKKLPLDLRIVDRNCRGIFRYPKVLFHVLLYRLYHRCDVITEHFPLINKGF